MWYLRAGLIVLLGLSQQVERSDTPRATRTLLGAIRCRSTTELRDRDYSSETVTLLIGQAAGSPRDRTIRNAARATVGSCLQTDVGQADAPDTGFSAGQQSGTIG